MKIRPIAVVLVLAASCGGCQAGHDKQGAENALNRGSAAYDRSDFHAAIVKCTEAGLSSQHC